MTTDTPIRYTLDHENRISEVNAAWDIFARGNDAPHLVGEHVRGRSLWDFVASSDVRQIYRDMLHKARHDPAPLRFTFRCDSPDLARVHTMKIQGLRDGYVCFEATIDSQTPHPRRLDFVYATGESPEFLRMCSVCKGIKTNGHWTPIDEAIDRLGLFRANNPVQISHGLCPVCYERLASTL